MLEHDLWHPLHAVYSWSAGHFGTSGKKWVASHFTDSPFSVHRLPLAANEMQISFVYWLLTHLPQTDWQSGGHGGSWSGAE